MSSHGLLDALTQGGYGVALFSPFDAIRYNFPFTPIIISPINIKGFFSEWGLKVVLSELIWVILPLAIVTAVSMLIRRKYQKI